MMLKRAWLTKASHELQAAFKANKCETEKSRTRWCMDRDALRAVQEAIRHYDKGDIISASRCFREALAIQEIRP